MNTKFEKFSDWEKKKFEAKGGKENPDNTEVSSPQLIAELEDLQGKKKKALTEKDGYEAQILEISIKLKKLEIERNNLLKKQKDLSEARDIAKKIKLEGKSHDQE